MNVIKYIQNQELHHNRETFDAEYKMLLEEFDMAYDQRYVFNDPS